MKFPFQDPIFADLPRAYLVGGSVRDIVRGAEPVDYDVVVPGPPLQFAQLMADKIHGKVITLGKDHFKVYRVVSKNFIVDVTPLKGDDIEADLKARDFTFNALAWEFSSGKIIDYLGGVKDLQAGRIKMVSAEAFIDDPARLVRAFRMAATMGFQIEPSTLQAIADRADAVRQVAGERIWAELERILVCPESLPTIRQMADSQLLQHFIPELRSTMGCTQNRHHSADVFTHTLQAYGALEALLNDPGHFNAPSTEEWLSRMPINERLEIKFAILLHDTGKPESRSVTGNGSVHFYGHAARGAAHAKRICQRLRTSNRCQDRIESIIRHHQRPLSLFLAQHASGLRPKTVGRFFRQCASLTPYILLHAIADDLGKEASGDLRDNERTLFYQDLMGKYFEAITRRAGVPLINGRDLMKRFDIEPSPRLGKILKTIEELQMAGVLNDRGQAIQWVAEYLFKKP